MRRIRLRRGHRFWRIITSIDTCSMPTSTIAGRTRASDLLLAVRWRESTVRSKGRRLWRDIPSTRPVLRIITGSWAVSHLLALQPD